MHGRPARPARAVPCRSVALALGVALLAACGGSRATTPDSGTGGLDPVDARIDAPPPDAPPDAFRPPDAPAPLCVAPCLAAGVFDGSPSSITVRDGIVYVAAMTNGDHNNYVGSIHAVGPDGHVTTLATDQSRPDLLMVDGATLYYCNQGFAAPPSFEVHEQAIMKIARTGGAPEVVLAQPTLSHTQAPASMLIDGGFLYFDDLVASGTVNRLPLAGGPVQTLAQNDLRPGQVHVLPTTLAVHGDDLYWVSNDGGVATMPKAGGTPTYVRPPPVTSPSIGGFHNLVIDDQNIYVDDLRFDAQQHITTDLLKLPLQGGAATPLVENVSLIRSPLIRDADDIFVASVLVEGQPEDLYRVPIAGGAPVKVVNTRYDVYTIDETYVYWAADGIVYRTPR
jgi:hypothetical protein